MQEIRSRLSYAKLTLVGAAGIVLTALIVASAVDSRVQARGRRVQAQLVQPAALEYRPDCSQPDGCLDKKYVSGLLAVIDNQVGIEQAARDLCKATAWASGSAQHLAELSLNCEAATRKRIARDLK